MGSIHDLIMRVVGNLGHFEDSPGQFVEVPGSSSASRNSSRVIFRPWSAGPIVIAGGGHRRESPHRSSRVGSSSRAARSPSSPLIRASSARRSVSLSR